MKTTELKFYQRVFTKAPVHHILMSKAPVLRCPRRKWETARAKAYLNRKGRREKLQCSRRNCWVKVQQAEAEHGKGQGMPQVRRTPHNRERRNLPRTWSTWAGYRDYRGQERKAPLSPRKTVYDCGIWIQSVIKPIWPLSLFQNMFREKTSRESFFLQHRLLADPGKSSIPVPGLLEAEGSSNSNLLSKLRPQN